MLGVISIGGGVGGLARYGLGLWFPSGSGGFPWTTFGVNVSGCLLIGVLLVLAGGMLGAPARYLADRWVQSRHDSAFPWGTWAVNVAGSVLLGFLAAGVADGAAAGAVAAGVGIGFCGALTTYSTFGYDAVRLIEAGRWWYALLCVAGSLGAGLGAATGCALLAVAVWG